ARETVWESRTLPEPISTSAQRGWPNSKTPENPRSRGFFFFRRRVATTRLRALGRRMDRAARAEPGRRFVCTRARRADLLPRAFRRETPGMDPGWPALRQRLPEPRGFGVRVGKAAGRKWSSGGRRQGGSVSLARGKELGQPSVGIGPDEFSKLARLEAPQVVVLAGGEAGDGPGRY